MSGLTLALPGGALFEGACELLAAAGVGRVSESVFARALMVEESGTTFVKVRPTDIPVYVEMGAADCGIVGKDVLWESSRESYELVDLRFGACRMVLAAPEGSPLARGDWSGSFRVATKYPESARRYFSELSVTVELIRLHGSIELAAITGLADAIFDITATGTTLRANHLVEVAEAGCSTARLIVNHAALKTKSDAVNTLAATLRRAAAARSDEGAA